MPRPAKVETETTGEVKRRPRTKTKYVNMTIDQFLAALATWEKEGEELRAVGARFQSAMNNAGVGTKVAMPYQTPAYNNVNAMTPVPAPANIGEQWETPMVSMIDPMLEQNQLQDNISNQLLQIKQAQPIEPF